jgi:CDP-diglyceride synthetase
MFYFKRNLPMWERTIRVTAGLAFAGTAILFSGTPAVTPALTWLGAAGGIMLAAIGFVGYCPMCAMVGRRLDEGGK